MSASSQKKIIIVSAAIGTGKRLLLAMLKQLGYAAIDADEVEQALTAKGARGYQQLLEAAGPEILDRSGDINRFWLHQARRSHPEVEEKLRSILSGLVREQLQELIAASGENCIFIACNEAETYGLRELGDQLWILRATPQRRISNLVQDRRWPETLARQYVLSDVESPTPARQADVVLRNDGSRGELWSQLTAALRGIGGVPATYAAPMEAPELPAEVATEAIEAPAPGEVGAPRGTAATPEAAASAERPAPAPSLGIRELRLIGRRLINSLVVLLVIAFLTAWGLMLAEYGRQHLPVKPMQAAWQAVIQVGQYVVAHPQSYYWARENVPWLELVGRTLGNSAGLLLLSMGAALVLGLALGIRAATSTRKTSSALMMVVSVLGASTPSFLVGMLLWALNIWVHRTFNVAVLPGTGYGWDAHVIMPVLVLAMRPLAQIAQVTYITMGEALRQDYVRTAHAKGLSWRRVREGHVLPNTLIPILNTLGSSLRFSLASLPVVEIFFHWPGVGLMLLDAIEGGTASLVMDLILSLGLFFLLVNLLIEFSFPLIDPRLRAEETEASHADKTSLLDRLREVRSRLAESLRTLRRRRAEGGEAAGLPALPAGPAVAPGPSEKKRPNRMREILQSALRNPVFVVSTVLLTCLVALALFGEQLKNVQPYQVHGIMTIGGKIAAPPFAPSSVFPWGSDHIGRDIRSLVLAGARRTLALAFFGMLARVILGTFLGLLAGWNRGGWVDRLVTGAVGVWAAFPVTLFAMIVIQALGIQQGMWVFVVAISVVGWGEVAQFVRGQVMALKPQQFIESARAVGVHTEQILTRHVFPNLVNSLTVLAALEMGGVLMLLAELGFLNIFMGGGFRTAIGEVGRMSPVVAYYSDVPEWSALIANVREYWRSYPWMAVYPGAAIFLSIVSFNLFGEGLRRFLEDSRLALGRVLNRYTLLAALGGGVILSLVLQAATPINAYRKEAYHFDQTRLLEDIRVLSSPMLQGRETGTPGADLAALYIAQRMAEIGIFPAGEHHTYYQRLVQPRYHLYETPQLSEVNGRQFSYRKDFAEIARTAQSRGEAQASIMGAAYGPLPSADAKNSEYGLGQSAAMDHVLIVRAEDADKVAAGAVKGILVIADKESDLVRRDVYPYELVRAESVRPQLLISPEVADTLLRTAGSSLAQFDAMRAALLPGQLGLTNEGSAVSMSVEPRDSEDYLNEAYINVLGVIPGQGRLMGMEDQIIIVSAYYDGLGTDTLGTLYPGANDNASGVAMMLELARVLKQSAYQPDKTVLFVAWAGGERQEGLSVVNVLNARPGAGDMTVESVLELSGVGYGTGKSVAIGSDSSYRLVQLFQTAASKLGVATTTRGRGPHYDLPAQSMFGGREAMTLALSWDGSDSLAHTPQDTVERIDPVKLGELGRSAYLTLLVLCRETAY